MHKLTCRHRGKRRGVNARLARLWLDCLGGIAENACSWQLRQLTPEEWDDLVALSRRHQLTALLYTRLRGFAPPVSLPAGAEERLRVAYRARLFSGLLRQRELTLVLRALETEHVSPVAFKGAAFAYTRYPTPECREMADHDFWLTGEEMARAQAALERIGYARHDKESRPPTWQVHREGEIQLRGTRPGQSVVELHWGVFPGEWLHRTTAIDRAGVRARLVVITIANRPVLTLAPEDALIQVAVHLVVGSGLPAGGTLRRLMDVVLLARDIADWDVVIARARAWRVANVVSLVVMLSDTLFGLPSAQTTLARFRLSSVRAALVTLFVTPRSIVEGRQSLHGGLRWPLLLLLVDRPRDLVTVFLRALWPEREWLRMRYGGVTLHIRVSHLARALTGRI